MTYSSIRSKAPASPLAFLVLTTFLVLEGTGLAQTLPAPWAAIDIGSPAIQGTTTYSGGTFTVTAGGTDVGGTSDQFTFVYQVMSGDGVIVARVPSLRNTSGWAKAGVMIRESLAPNATNVFAAVTPTRGVIFQRRRVSGGNSVITNGGTGKAPVWLKIRRRGKVLTASRSADGVAWQDIGTEIISMAGDVDVGLAVTSHKASAATSAQFSRVSVAPPDLPTSGLLSWSGADVGLPSVGGSQQVQDDDIIVSGAGSIGGTFDQFHYMYRQVSGDADIVARIKAVQYIAAGSRGGVMVRDSLGGNGTHVSMLLRAGSGTILQSRTVPGGSTTTSAVGALEPYWVKLEVRGQVVTAFQSPDGVSWSTVGGAPLSLPSPYYIGVAVASQDAQTLANAAFDQLRLVEVGQNQPPTIALTGPDTSVSYTAPANVTISADASDADGTISSVDFYQNGTLLGSVSTPPYAYTWPSVPSGTYTFSAVAHDNGGATSTSATRTITVRGASNAPPAITLTAPATGSRFVAPATINVSATASDSDGSIARVQFYSGANLLATVSAPPYTFAWTNVQAGTYTLTAVAQDDKGASSTSAAATITVSAPNQAPTVSLTAPANGATFTAPAAIAVSASASDSDGTITKVDFFAGTTLIGTDTTSPYSITWNNVGAGSYTLTAVATDNAGAATTSAARTITVTGLPTPWQQTDIGSPSAPGGARYANGTFTIDGRGILWVTPDQFHYVYQPFTGDVTVTAHIVSMENTNAWAKAGVMIRQTLAGDSAHASMVVTAGNGSNFFYRATAGASSTEPVSTGSGSWVRLERRGTTVTGYQSTDGATWTAVGSMTLSTVSAFVGLAVSSDDPSLTATHVLDNVNVSTPTANQPPTVSLTAPANGATFTAPATITVSANASDTDGTIAKVDFFAGSTLIGTDTASPYSVSWSNVGAGTYSLTAVATDNAGGTTTSAARTITVSGGANQPPTASLTAPANGATFTAPATITVSATASDTDGTIAKVDFFRGATLIGTDTTSPYSVTWSNAGAGSYTLTAVATDSGGATTTSAARTITVSSGATTTSAVFTASADHTTLVTHYVLDIFASGANPNTATPIASQDLGKPAVVSGDCTADITQTFNALAAGNYIATVSAVGNGGSSRSTATAFTR